MIPQVATVGRTNGDGEHHLDSWGDIIVDGLAKFELEQGYSWMCGVGFARAITERGGGALKGGGQGGI